MGLVEVLVLGLAAYRGTQLAVHDTVLDPARDRVFAWQARRPESRPRQWVITLISCTYCMGWWVAGAALGIYVLAADTWPGVPEFALYWFAVAGVQALLNRWDDTRPSSAGAGE